MGDGDKGQKAKAVVKKDSSVAKERKEKGEKIYYSKKKKKTNKAGKEKGPDPVVLEAHLPTRSQQFIPIIKGITKLHEKKQCYGDLRLTNLIFYNTSDNESKLLDSNITGRRKKALYPDHFEIDAVDSPRHKKAISGNQLQYKHDWYSLSKIMGFLEPTKAKFKAEWENTTRLVKSGCTEMDPVTSILSKRMKLQVKEDKKESLQPFIPEPVKGTPAIESRGATVKKSKKGDKFQKTNTPISPNNKKQTGKRKELPNKPKPKAKKPKLTQLS